MNAADKDTLLAAAAGTPEERVQQLDRLIACYPWFTAARALRARLTGAEDAVLSLLAADRGVPVAAAGIDAGALLHLSPDDLIDRFLLEKDLRIVAGEETPDSPAEEIVTEALFDEEDDLVSEELAEVYLSQGLYDEAEAIYRRLSLLNSEKSVYFAELIEKMKQNKINS